MFYFNFRKNVFTFAHNADTASTTTILNSSEISDIKFEICFINRSTELSDPVFKRVVMAKVAIDLLVSVIKFSRSRLQAVTADGCFIATLLRLRTPAYLKIINNFQKLTKTCAKGF